MDEKPQNNTGTNWHENITNDPYERYREQPRGCRDIFFVLIWIALALVIMLLTGCRTCQPIVQTIEKERIVEIHTRDTAIVTQADSASIRALLKCDSAYNVVVWELVTQQGERIETDTRTQYTDNWLLLQMDCKEDSLSHIIQMQDSIIRELTKETDIVREKYVPDYYKNTSKGFWVLFAILLILVGWRIYKLIIKIKSGGLL